VDQQGRDRWLVYLLQKQGKTIRQNTMEHVSYYTPAIEDLRIGYECQIKNGASAGDHWHPVLLDKYLMESVVFKLKEGNIRTHYLLANDIEAAGWEIKAEGHLNGEYDESGDRGTYTVHGFKDNYMFSYIGRRLTILLVDPWKDEQITGVLRSTLYSGSCPSINEFRYISKLLNL
jgi:hypothetical protein